MARIPQYNRSVTPQNTSYGYVQSNATPEAFGVNISGAMKNLGDAGLNALDAMATLKANYDKTKLIEFSNFIDNWSNKNLYDKDKGYFNKTGKEAMGKSPEMMDSFDKYADEYIAKAGFVGGWEQKARQIVQQKRNTIERYVEAHDKQETDKWQDAVYTDAITNVFSKAIQGRNNPADLSMFYRDGLTVLDNYAATKGWDKDPETLAIKKKEYEESFHAQILDAYLAEGSLKASEYLETHKEKINPKKLPHYINAVQNNELKYFSKNTANNLFTMYADDEQKAINELDKMNLKPDEYDATLQNMSALYSRKRRLMEQEKSDAKKQFWDNAAIKIKNGEPLTLDDISDKLTGKDYIDARKAIESLNKKGDIETDLETKTYLEYISNYDAQRFKSMDLSQYRLKLSSDDYTQLEKRQQAIQKGDFYTIIKDNDNTKEYIKQVTSINANTAKLYDQYQNMVRSFEMREGRSATNIEKEQFLKYLGSDEDNYKLIEKQIKNGNEFYNGLANNIAYYQSHHNGEMPPDDMVNKWIKDQSIQYYNKKYSQYYNNAIKTVQPKQNEQITLTYFADEVVPTISQKIRADLKITDRYRAPNGKYTSKHSEGRALDISYRTKDGEQLSLSQKMILWEEILKDPTVEKVAVSSADKDGAALIKKFNKYRYKIQDMNSLDSNGKSRDINLGTNHTNHIHVTLYKDNTYKGVDKVTIKNQLKQKGFTDEQISQYLLSKGY